MSVFTSREEAMKYLVKQFVPRNILEEDQIQAEIANIVKAIPETTRDMYGDDDTIAAANFYPTYSGMQGNANEGNNNSVVTTQDGNAGKPAAKRQREAYVLPALSDAAKDKVKEILEQTMEQRIAATPQTQILKLLTRLPKQSTYLAGKKVTPICSPEKLAEYEKILVQTPENIAAFERIKEACNKTQLEVYINDKNDRVEGVIVRTPAVNAEGKAAMEDLALSNEGVCGFLTTRVMGRIPSVPVVGVELRRIDKVKGSAGRHADSSSKAGKPTLRWVGKASAFEQYGQYVQVTSVVEEGPGKKPATKPLRVRIKDSFLVEGKVNQAGKKTQRTIRLTGTLNDAPKFVRAKEFEFLGALSDSQTISAVMTEKEKEEAMQRSIDMFSAAGAQELVNGAGAYGEMFSSLVRQITDANKKDMKNAADAYEG